MPIPTDFPSDSDKVGIVISPASEHPIRTVPVVMRGDRASVAMAHNGLRGPAQDVWVDGRSRTYGSWNTQVIPIMLSGDRLQKVAADGGYGGVHPSAPPGLNANDQPRSRPLGVAVGWASAGEGGQNAPVLVT